MAITSHPGNARYFRSRSLARAACGKGEKVRRLGVFAGGSFGVYPPILGNGRYRGQLRGMGGFGPIPMVTVWMVS